MEKLNLFVRDNCPVCADLMVPSDLNINILNTNSEKYEGYIPPTVPVLQVGGIDYPGKEVIEGVLKLLSLAQEGNFKKDE